MTVAVPKTGGFSQTRAGGNNGGVANRAILAFVQYDKILGGEAGDAVGVGFEVIDEPDVFEVERVLDVLIHDDPWQICDNDAALPHRTGNSETGVFCLQFSLGQKFLDDFLEAGEIAAGIGREVFGREAQMFAEESEINFCAADVTCKNHGGENGKGSFSRQGIYALAVTAARRRWDSQPGRLRYEPVVVSLSASTCNNSIPPATFVQRWACRPRCGRRRESRNRPDGG